MANCIFEELSDLYITVLLISFFPLSFVDFTRKWNEAAKIIYIQTYKLHLILHQQLQ